MRIIIFGAGGMGRELLRPLRESLASAGEQDRSILFATDKPSGDQIHTDDIRPDDDVLIALGDPGDRQQVSERIGGRPLSFFAPANIIGQNVQIDEGAVFLDFSMVTCDAAIGRYFQCSYYAHVSHDCRIGDFVTFAPGARCNGGVTIGDGSYIGSNAVVRQDITIGSNTIVGMGAVVTKDVPDGVTVAGNPARILDRQGTARHVFRRESHIKAD